MINYEVTLKTKELKTKTVLVCADSKKLAKKRALYWEDSETVIEEINELKQ